MKILSNRPFSILTFICLCISQTLLGQGLDYPLSNETGNAILERLDILYGNNSFYHTGTKPIQRADAVKYALYIDSTASSTPSKQDKADLQYIYDDNNDFLGQTELPKTIGEKNNTGDTATNYPPQYRTRSKPIFKYFYKTPANFWEHDSKYFQARLNPMLHLEFGRDLASDENVFVNRRGVDLRVVVDKRVYFQTQIIETQMNPVNYVRTWIDKYKAVPGAGFYKEYKSNVTNKVEGFDFLLAQGMVGFNVTKHIGMQLGHGRHFIGDGMRSLILSDFANNYFYLRLNTKVWKFHYQNIIAELSSENLYPGAANRLLDKKFLALHHLNYNVLPNLSFGVSEMVVMTRSRQFELQYLNPIIFYRAIEGIIGSPDNILIGLNSKWNVKKRVSLYGQLLFDEFLFKNLFLDKTGWWANKYGVQLGAKYLNAFNIDHLDLQVEYNKVRPFTYSHYDSTNNYTHAYQPLAHPLGANFREFLFRIRYQPTPKWQIDTRLMLAKVGENGGLGALGNWGNEPLAPNRLDNRVQTMEFGFFTTKGVAADILSSNTCISYQAYHNAFFELKINYRKKTSEDAKRNQNTSFLSLGLRLNMGDTRFDF